MLAHGTWHHSRLVAQSYLLCLLQTAAQSDDSAQTFSSPSLAVKKQADALKRMQTLQVVCRQLGPVLHSPMAESHGLGTSLLEAFVRYHESQSQQHAQQGLASCLGMDRQMCHDSFLYIRHVP